MSILTILIIIVVVGVVLWLVNTQIPMDATVKKILNITVVVLLVIWLLKIFGALDYLGNVTI